jgi:hypothetical protein
VGISGSFNGVLSLAVWSEDGFVSSYILVDFFDKRIFIVEE